MKIKYSKSNVRVKTRFLFHTRQKTVGLILHARLRKAEDVFSIKNIVLLPLIATFHPIASKRISSSLEEIPGQNVLLTLCFPRSFYFSPLSPFRLFPVDIYFASVIIARCGPRIFTALRFLMDRKVFKGVRYVYSTKEKKKNIYV